MNPLLAALVTELSPVAKDFVNGLRDAFIPEPEDEVPRDVDVMAEKLLEVMRERDDLRRQLRDIRAAHEGLHHALYPGLASMKWNSEK